MLPPESHGAARERLNRYLARSGVGSRRRADDLIVAGRVTLNGEVVTRLATQVLAGVDTITLDGKVIAATEESGTWLLMYKPAGTLTTKRDMRGRKTVYDLLPPHLQQLIVVGRLDYDTEGPLLFTSDGHAANRLMHPKYQVKRIYEAHVDGIPSDTTLRRCTQGVDLGDPTLARAEAKVVHSFKDSAIIRLTMREGRKREVKRLMLELGHRVRRLKRVAFAGINTKGLEPGDWRILEAHEIAKLVNRPEPKAVLRHKR